MKNIGIILTGALFITLLFTQCTKDDNSKIFNAKFYTTKAQGKLYLYVDDVYKGELPYFSSVPECGASYSDAQKPLAAQLPSGEYKIVGKDEQDRITSHATIKISRNTIGSSGGIGGLRLDNNDECLAIGLSE